MVIDAVFVV